MMKVSRALAAHPKGLTSTEVQQLVTSKKDYIRKALNALVEDGYVARIEETRLLSQRFELGVVDLDDGGWRTFRRATT